MLCCSTDEQKYSLTWYCPLIGSDQDLKTVIFSLSRHSAHKLAHLQLVTFSLCVDLVFTNCKFLIILLLINVTTCNCTEIDRGEDGRSSG